MFCDACGNSMAADQRYCPSCGKPAGANRPPASPGKNRVASHIRLLGILWLAISATRVFGALILWFASQVWVDYAPDEMRWAMTGILGLVGVMIGLLGILGLAAGWGLIERKPWSRMLAIGLGVLSLFELPFGTALGVYTLWVLLPAQNEEDFRRLQRVA